MRRATALHSCFLWSLQNHQECRSAMNCTTPTIFNVYRYRNFYNGGGTAIGDISGDGLPDIFMVGNQVPNRLYLNKGDFEFEGITHPAGVAGKRAWSTGVTMADINGDGWLDIYVCNSGIVEGDDKRNELYINLGDGTFTEQAEEYGIAEKPAHSCSPAVRPVHQKTRTLHRQRAICVRNRQRSSARTLSKRSPLQGAVSVRKT